jgi:hypothetical protein
MSTGTDGWKPENGDGRVKFGHKARQWMAGLIRARLVAEYRKRGVVWEADQLDAVVAWYEPWVCVSEDLESLGIETPYYATWVPTDSYRGSGFSTGEWRVLWYEVLRDLPEAVVAVARTIDAKWIHSLEDWLRADLAGTLHYGGAKGGTDRLDQHQRLELMDATYRRRKSWPRICADCGESRPPAKLNAKRCRECVELRKQKRTGAETQQQKSSAGGT